VKLKIAILDDYQDEVRKLDCFQLLANHDVIILNATFTDELELAGYLSGVEALVLIRERTQITPNLLSLLPDLKVIIQTGKVSNHINPKVCAKYGVEVLEGVGSPTAPAELTWALIMAASRNLNNYVSEFSSGNWQQTGDAGLGRKLEGLNLGIWGYGKIGQRIARYSKTFGMNVTVWGRKASRKLAIEHGFNAADSKEEFFCQSDIVTLHLRLNGVTRHCVTKDDLSLMKPDSLLVNTSRAELIEPDAVYNEMRLNPSKSAAVDVYEIEPATTDNCKILSLPNVLCSPHIGYVEKSSYELYFRTAFENLLRYSESKR
jgi:D-3-phosphoglycerate dehydrogenase